MSHNKKKSTKSIWSNSNKHHVPTNPAVMKPKPFVVWEKSIHGETAVCQSCKTTYHALHSSQKHLVSSINGHCYHCRDINIAGKVPKSSHTEVELKGTPAFPQRPITRELWSRGGRGFTHSKKDERRLKARKEVNSTKNTKTSEDQNNSTEYIHLGRIIRNRLDARYTCLDASITIRSKISFPLWSCCLQPFRGNDTASACTCSKAKARAVLTEKVNNPVDELAKMSNTFITRPHQQQPQPTLEAKLAGE